MELLTKLAKRLNKTTPLDFPEGAVLNVRCCVPLPEGWHHAMKVTGKSGRGNGGILRHCYIGPGGLVKWHKYDLEKHLGIKIEGEQESVHHFISPVIFEEFPEDAIIRRTDNQIGCEYMLKRCDGLNGKTVSDALYSYQYKRSDLAGSKQYSVSDLRYDIKGGRIELDMGKATAASQPLKQKPVKKDKPVNGSKKQQVSTSAVKRGKTLMNATAASSKSSARSSNAGLQIVVKPLLSRAAKGAASEGDIYTMLGIGHQLNMDQLMLKVLPEVLRKSPADRGSFGEGVLKQFEAEVDRCL
jgi:hypothetical protein